MILLGSGETGSVYSIGKGRVVKLFHEDRYIEDEYKACKYMGDQTPFAPRIYELVEMEGKKGYEMQEIEGELLLDLLDGSGDFEILAKLVGESHRVIHDYDGSHLKLPNLKDVMFLHIDQLKHFNEVMKEWLRGLLEDLPSGHALLHGDFMPYNLIYSEGRLTALDWSDAMMGPAEADIARSIYFILDPNDYDDAVFTKKSNKFIEAYLNGYYGNRSTMGIIRRWLLINVVFQYDIMISKGIVNDFSDRLKTYIDKNFEKLGSDSLF